MARFARLFWTEGDDAVDGWRLFDGLTLEFIQGAWDTVEQAMSEIDRKRYEVVAEPRWAIHRGYEDLERDFEPGTPVLHANPELSDWRGVVAPLTQGPNKGNWLTVDRKIGWVGVRVKMTIPGRARAKTDWYEPTGLIPARCYQCGKTGDDVEYTEDPYAAEIHDKHRMIVVCADDLKALCDDI